MARPGVTYIDVAEAASHISGQGKNPTIEQIRLFLGTGSSTTIANHLKQWKSAQQGTVLLAAKENLPQELVAMLKGLWGRVIDHSEIKINAIEESSEQTVTELQQELQKYKINNRRWQQLFNRWTKEHEQLSNDKLDLQQAIAALNEDNTALQSKYDVLAQQLEEKQERIHELHHLHTQAQINIERDRENAREQRLIEQQQFEQQKQELQTKNKALKEKIIVLREKNLQLQQQQQLLQQTHTVLTQNHSRAELSLEKMREELIEAEKNKNEYLQTSQHWQNQYQAIQKTLENKTTKLIEAQTKANVLVQQLADTKHLLSNSLEQNKQFAHEKWALAQEKAQLEGQVKQMQTMVSA